MVVVVVVDWGVAAMSGPSSRVEGRQHGCPGDGGGDGGPYVVMEHMPKPQQKLRHTRHFSVRVVVGSVFCFSFP